VQVRRHLPLTLLLALSCGGGAGEGGDRRCSLANCQILESCGLLIEGQPLPHECRQKTGGGPEMASIAKYCPAACEAGGGGAVLECTVHPPDGSVAQCVFPPACNAGGGQPNACTDACAQKRDACEATCPTTSFDACLDCSARCGLDLVRCLRPCPL
jgi:hypothetical protein